MSRTTESGKAGRRVPSLSSFRDIPWLEPYPDRLLQAAMPTAPYLFEGRDAIMGLFARAQAKGEWRLVPIRANRQPAAASYLRAPGDTEFRAFKIDVLRVVDGMIAEVTTFGDRYFPAFELPAVLA
jgi:hypothetical protein